MRKEGWCIGDTPVSLAAMKSRPQRQPAADDVDLCTAPSFTIIKKQGWPTCESASLSEDRDTWIIRTWLSALIEQTIITATSFFAWLWVY